MLGTRGRAALVVAAVVAIGTAGAGAQAATPSNAVSARTFTTKAPNGWTVKASRPGSGTRTFNIAAKAANARPGIPPAGAVTLTVAETLLSGSQKTVAQYKRGSAILRAVVRPPVGVQKVKTSGIGTFRLDGRDAASITYTYTYRGRRIRQQNTAIRYGDYVVITEVDADTSNHRLATQSRAKLQRFWNWR